MLCSFLILHLEGMLPRCWTVPELPVTFLAFALKNIGIFNIIDSLLVKDFFCLALQHCPQNPSPLPLYYINALSTEMQTRAENWYQIWVEPLFPVGFLPEGTAAVLKGTEPNMSVLAGSDWDEDGIKASPGVAGVCKKTGIKNDGISAAASAARLCCCIIHHSKNTGLEGRKGKKTEWKDEEVAKQ